MTQTPKILLATMVALVALALLHCGAPAVDAPQVVGQEAEASP
jgi:hypothetical protein